MPEWVKSGSALGAKNKMSIGNSIMNRNNKKLTIRLNKRGAMNYTEIKEIKDEISSWPVNYAGSTVKYENGKNRALYPVD